MVTNKVGFKDYLDSNNTKATYSGRLTRFARLEETAKSLLEFGAALPNAVTSNILSKTPNRRDATEEEPETTINKIDIARRLFQTLINRPDLSRKDIIQHFIDHVGVTNSTAVSYYERLAKEAGLTNKDDAEDLGLGVDMSGPNIPTRKQTTSATNSIQQPNNDQDSDVEQIEPEMRDGVIRTVQDAHLIFKRQVDDGTFEELWIYNTSNTFGGDIKIRHDILAGTDIPPKKTKSPDGSQSYTLTNMGNAQYLHITGLPN